MQNDISVPDLENAIKSHEAWKQHLRDAIKLGKSEINSSLGCRDDQCDFGKWLYAAISHASPNNKDAYEVVRQLHAKFHHCAGNVIACLEREDSSAAFALMEGEYKTSSEVLVNLLHDWRYELKIRDGIQDGPDGHLDD